MRIIFKKTAEYLANDLTKQFVILLKSHGIKPKEVLIQQFRHKMYISLGGKKNK